MAETLAAARCPRCRRLVVPPARLCPDHPVPMEAAGVAPLGEVVSLTTLHSPPEGFRAPLHIAPRRAASRERRDIFQNKLSPLRYEPPSACGARSRARGSLQLSP